MAQQNKSTARGVSQRLSELEKDLVGGMLDGDVSEGVSSSSATRTTGLMISSGFRRRHPSSVLSQYSGVVASTDGLSSVWTKTLQDEDAKDKASKKFDNTNYGMANQFGLDKIAVERFYGKNALLKEMHVVGT
tara:strand:+ start:60 stop:458 length:399 start_codon:yes stop_codon:yes gene_type:complete